jgi:hypothetical protein
MEITYTKVGNYYFAKRANLIASGKTREIAKRELLETERFFRIANKKN